jgi:NADPH-dependent 2,4-dienoyl-CoA reductase/sulfur reductase-like enzyme
MARQRVGVFAKDRRVKVPLLVIGGGPAGMAAAIEAARAGLACTLVDEGPRLGGQIYRQPPSSFRVCDARALGRDYARGEALRAELAAAGERIDARAGTSVVGIWGREVAWVAGDASGTITAERMVLATGAYDRPVPFPGWTLPGVLTAGGAQGLVKTMHVVPGRRALVAGTGPLLLVVANQLHQVGVEVAAVVEAGRPSWSPRAFGKVWRERGLLKDAWDYWRALRRAGIPLRFNQTVFAAHGAREVEAVTCGPVDPETWRPIRERARQIEVDLLVVGFGFVPNTELTALAGCRHEYVHELGGWIPVRGAHLETTVPGVFAAGDGAGVAGALVAVEEGRIAGITAAEQAGTLRAAEADRRRAPLLARLRSLARAREVLDEISRIRPGLTELATPDTVACRCEEVSIAEVDGALAQGARDLQAIKLLTRLGMGPCQGRNCGPSMALHVAHAAGGGPEAMGRINPRPPVRPATVGALSRLDRPDRLDRLDPDRGARGLSAQPAWGPR